MFEFLYSQITKMGDATSSQLDFSLHPPTKKKYIPFAFSTGKKQRVRYFKQYC